MTTRDKEKAEDRFRMLDAIIQDRIDEGARNRIAAMEAEIEALRQQVAERGERIKDIYQWLIDIENGETLAHLTAGAIAHWFDENGEPK